MADNFAVSDRTGTSRTLRTTDTGTAHIPHHVDEGALNLVTGQVTAGSAATLVAARATRKRVTITNTDGTNAVYVGPATVTSGNGYKLAPGATVVLTAVILIQCLAAAGSPVVCFADEYF